MVNENVYVVYKGDIPVAVGTAKECAMAMRVKIGTICYRIELVESDAA